MTRMPTAVGAVLIVAAAVAQAAVAKPGPQSAPPAPLPVQDVSASSEATGDGSTATATATCPGGTKATGGGFDAPSSADVVGIVYESVKVHQRAWRASVQLLDPGDPSVLTLTTHVYCRDQYPATQTSSQTVPTTGELQLGPTASATCPRGEAAIAGGFHMPPPLVSPTVTELFFDSMRSSVSSWDARVVTGPAGPSSLTSEAYCTGRASAPTESVVSGPPNGLDSTTSTVTATCPPGTAALAGGFAQPESGPLSFYFVTSSMGVGDAWQVSGFHTGSEPAVPLNAAAYCS